MARSLPSEFLKLANQEVEPSSGRFFISPVSFMGVRPPSPSLQQRTAAKETSCHLDGLAYHKIAHLVDDRCFECLFNFIVLVPLSKYPSSYTTLEQLSCLAKLPL